MDLARSDSQPDTVCIEPQESQNQRAEVSSAMDREEVALPSQASEVEQEVDNDIMFG